MAPQKGSRLTRFTEAEREQILALYAQGLDRETIARQIGRSSGRGVGNVVREAGISRKATDHIRKYHPREGAFDNAEGDEAAAYWVGFLLADGSISDPDALRQPMLRVELAAKDSSHLGLLATFLDLPPEAVRASKNGAAVRLGVRSARLASALAAYGVTPRKSLTASPQRLLDNRHFWRGVVDGDGCLHIAPAKRKYQVVDVATLGIVGSHATVHAFSLYASTIAQNRITPYQVGNIWTWTTTGSVAAKMIAAMYADCTTALARKHAIAVDVMTNMPSGSRVISQEEGHCAEHPRGQNFLEFEGRTLPIAEWARIKGITAGAIHARIRYGWPVERILAESVHGYSGKTIGCSVEGCKRPHAAKGFCSMHWKQNRKALRFTADQE